MKLKFDVECTPEEARSFLGLPNVAPMQDRVVDELEKRLITALKEADSATLLDQWMPLGLKMMEQWPTIWAQMATAAAGMTRRPDGSAGSGSSSGKRRD
ncbi:MAG: DUF6489 family protein [Pseudomonadota bacterium]